MAAPVIRFGAPPGGYGPRFTREVHQHLAQTWRRQTDVKSPSSKAAWTVQPPGVMEQVHLAVAVTAAYSARESQHPSAASSARRTLEHQGDRQCPRGMFGVTSLSRSLFVLPQPHCRRKPKLQIRMLTSDSAPAVGAVRTSGNDWWHSFGNSHQDGDPHQRISG